MVQTSPRLLLKRLGINTYKHAIIFMRADSPICRAEGFEAPARIRVTLGNKSILATLNTIENGLLAPHEASLSNHAWDILDAKEGEYITVAHPQPLQSLSYIRSKIYGHTLADNEIHHLIQDIAKERFSDIHMAAFLSACAGDRLNDNEILALTKAMINVGDTLTWPSKKVVDKHCVGGLPGNRTTLIIVPIVTAFGLMMPKTSSRSITSPAGTADTMEVFAPVDLDLKQMRKVVEKEQGCIIWGGTMAISPADDVLIHVERALELDGEGQLVASILSKKIAIGSTHILIDMPVGPSAKVRDMNMAIRLKGYLDKVGAALGTHIETVFTDGSQPIGRGIGPALEAHDILAVLQNKPNAPQDLRERALLLAAKVLEFSSDVGSGTGYAIAKDILEKGLAFKKFLAICEAQGGFSEPGIARYTHAVLAKHSGKIISINNRQLARLAKLVGAPNDKAAGIVLHTPVGSHVECNQPLFTLHSESKGELRYALSLLEETNNIFQIEKWE